MIFLLNTLVHATPRFREVLCQDIEGVETKDDGEDFDLCLEVDYEVRATDYALLEVVDGQDTVYWGHLLYERTNVAVTIEDPNNRNELEV